MVKPFSYRRRPQPPLEDFLLKLLDKDPARRLGANGASEVKAHEFFQDVKLA